MTISGNNIAVYKIVPCDKLNQKSNRKYNKLTGILVAQSQSYDYTIL